MMQVILDPGSEAAKIESLFKQEITQLEASVLREKRQKETARAQLTLQDQLVEKEKIGAEKRAKDMQLKIDDLNYNLNRKEYVLQRLEKKNLEYEKLLKGKAKEDNYVRNRLKIMGVEDNVDQDQTISNVVEENENLKIRLQELQTEVSSPMKGSGKEQPAYLVDLIDSSRSSKEQMQEEITRLRSLNKKQKELNAGLLATIASYNESLDYENISSPPMSRSSSSNTRGSGNLLGEFERALDEQDANLSTI